LGDRVEQAPSRSDEGALALRRLGEDLRGAGSPRSRPRSRLRLRLRLRPRGRRRAPEM